MINILVILGFFSSLFGTEEIEINHNYLDNQIQISIENFEGEYKEYQAYLKEKNSWKGESAEKISKKLDKYLHSSLKGKSKFITEYSIKVGLDPYLAAAVMLQETGCYWTCSYLTRVCYNVAGNKGTPSCNGGSYRKFKSMDDGIKFAINKLNSYLCNR